jgi:hypothetical protein
VAFIQSFIPKGIMGETTLRIIGVSIIVFQSMGEVFHSLIKRYCLCHTLDPVHKTIHYDKKSLFINSIVQLSDYLLRVPPNPDAELMLDDGDCGSSEVCVRLKDVDGLE